MRNPPNRADRDRNRPSNDDAAPTTETGKHRARTIRDMFDKPLKRLTAGPPRRRPAGRRPDDPPDDYDLQETDHSSQRSRMRWTAPGAYVRSEAPPRNDPRRQPMDDDYASRRDSGDSYRGGGRGAPPQRAPQGPPDAYARDDAPDPRGMDASMRWQQPDWLSGGPPPYDPSADLAPPPPQLNPTNRQESPVYQASDEDPRQQTDYRATSARAALWASRTPSYEPDQPAQVAPRSFGEDERNYYEAFDTRRAPASLAHADASMARAQVGDYVPGAATEAERLRNEAKSTGRTFGPAPYFWDLVKKPRPTSPLMVGLFWLTSLLVFASALLTAAYAGVSVAIAAQSGYTTQVQASGTPAGAGLAFTEVMFTSRTDHVLLRGWFIPGVASPGHLTVEKTIIMVHGPASNRADSAVGQLALSEALAKAGFAVLTFDLRGSGASASAPTTMGYLEQRDVLGAVDFLRNGPPPYPKLERPTAIGVWGVSTGAVAALMAAAQEPALRAVVADSAFASALPIVQREIPRQSHVSHYFTPGIIEADLIMYGADYRALAPVNVVAQIAPRPILFIQGSADTFVPSGDMTALAKAAQQGKGAQVTSWSVEGAQNGQAYHTDAATYVSRVVAFFNASLAPAK